MLSGDKPIQLTGKKPTAPSNCHRSFKFTRSLLTKAAARATKANNLAIKTRLWSSVITSLYKKLSDGWYKKLKYLTPSYSLASEHYLLIYLFILLYNNVLKIHKKNNNKQKHSYYLQKSEEQEIGTILHWKLEQFQDKRVKAFISQLQQNVNEIQRLPTQQKQNAANCSNGLSSASRTRAKWNEYVTLELINAQLSQGVGLATGNHGSIPAAASSPSSIIWYQHKVRSKQAHLRHTGPLSLVLLLRLVPVIQLEISVLLRVNRLWNFCA